MPDTETSPQPTVIAYDGSVDAEAAVAEAARLFAGRPAVVVCAWRSVEDVVAASLTALPASMAAEAQRNMDQAAEAEARSFADRGAEQARQAGLDARAETIEAHGSVWPAIVRAADDHDAAAVVVGSRGRSGFASAVLGSVSLGVVHHTRRPVVVVKGGEPTSSS